MRSWAWIVLVAACLAALVWAGSAASAAAAPGSPDLTLTLTLVGGGTSRLVGDDVLVEATVVNTGNGTAAPFVVDIWASQGVWPRQTLQFTGLAPGANVSLTTSVPYRTQLTGSVLFRGQADPAGAVNDANLSNNAFTLEVTFVAYDTIAVGSRLASTTPLEAGDCLVFEVELRDGESIFFKADTREGAARIDEYLVDEANWANFKDAMRNGSATVTYFADFSTVNTNHISFSTAPLPAGHYYLILDNAAILQHGATPVGETTVTYSIAKIGSGLPVELLVLVAAVGAVAIVATLRWRPSFESTEAVLSVPAPAAGALSPEDEVDEGDGSDDEVGEGPDPPEEATEGAPSTSPSPPRPPRI